MKKPRWNKCVVVEKVFICKADDCCTCNNSTGVSWRCVYKKTMEKKTWFSKCVNPIAQKEALIFMIDKCERDAKWAGLQLSILE
jgi:hypothetical protein